MPTLRCYDLSGRNGGIHSWYDIQAGDVRAAIDAAMEILAQEDDWEGLPQVKDLRGACESLTEIIVDMEDGRHFRILGFYGPGRDDFTLLYGFQKNGNNVAYGPACRSALWRKEGVEKDGSRAPICNFP